MVYCAGKLIEKFTKKWFQFPTKGSAENGTVSAGFYIKITLAFRGDFRALELSLYPNTDQHIVYKHDK